MLEFQTPQQILDAYSNGMQGWVFNPATMDKLKEDGKLQYGAQDDNLPDGTGKRVLLWRYRDKFQPGACGQEPQGTGDCFVAGTLVRMADGTEQAIECVSVGDVVISHTGKKRRVLKTYRRRHSGEILKIHIRGVVDAIECTSNHPLYCYPNLPYGKRVGGRDRRDAKVGGWLKAEDLTKRMRVLLPKCTDDSQSATPVLDLAKYAEVRDGDLVSIKYSGKKIKRFMDADAAFAWLLGIYAAEGHVDGRATCWSFNRNEEHLADRVISIVQDRFKTTPSKNYLPSKPNVLIVKAHSLLLVRIIKDLLPGDCYTKQVPAVVFRMPLHSRLEFIRGWIDGDGYYATKKRSNSDHYYCKASGVTASRDLARQMASLMVSCGIEPHEIKKRKMPHQRVASTDVTVYGGDVFVLDKSLKAQVKVKVAQSKRSKVQLGYALPITSIESRKVRDIDVFCLEVEEEHSFIANNVAVHNCTSHGTRNGIDITKACDIVIHGDPEDYYKPTATEPHYGARGHGGEGSDPAILTRFVVDNGFLARENYPGVVDLSKYNWRIGHDWGRRGVPQAVRDLCKKHSANGWVQPRTPQEMMGLQLMGRGGHSGQSLGFQRSTDSQGVFVPITRGGGAWNHDMAHGGYDDTKDFYPFRVYFFINSWARWCDPPKKWPEDLYGPWPTGLIVCRADVFEEKVLRTGSVFYFKGVNGYPAKTLPDLGNDWMNDWN